jgi:SPX domain protein involved in polyphosphate accumulation
MSLVLAPISLQQLDDVAALRTRVDRKYVVTASCVDDLVDAFAGEAQVLDIDGERSFGIESLYFDTGDFALLRAAAQGRRHRYKVRTRLYSGQSTAVLEVKQKGGRGQTVKHRFLDRHGEAGMIDDDDRRFVDAAVGRVGASAELVPTLTTRYRRTTLVLPDAGVRVTLDEDLVCTDWARRSVSLASMIVETKSPAGSSAVDRWLWARGQRPECISKYSTAMVVLHPMLPSNKWHRTVRRHFS